MKRLLRISQRGHTLLELACAMAVGAITLGVLGSGSVTISRSLAASDHYMRRANDGTRLLDYVARDLRRAVRVGKLSGGTPMTLKDFTAFSVTDTTMLTINVPDYYSSNTPDNSPGSSFKTSRYPRTVLNTSSTYNTGSNPLLKGVVSWNNAVATLPGVGETTRFSTSGADEIQIRYYRAKRSAADATECFFRAEYPAGSSTPISAPVEIAEQVLTGDSSTQLTVVDPKANDNGKHFRIQTSFVSRYRLSNTATTGTTQSVDVTLRNPRRDP
jgi:type II secretory pathway component PulJ